MIIALAIIAVAVVAIAAVLVPLILELRRTVIVLRQVTEDKLAPTLEELLVVLKDVKKISDNIGGASEDVKHLSSSLRDMGDRIGEVNRLVGSVGTSTAIKIMSLRAGFMAAVGYVLTHFIKKGDRS